MADEGRLKQLEERYEGYAVYDNAGNKIGKVDELFVDEDDREEYIGVKTGLFGLSGTTLIPMDISRVDENDRSIRIQAEKEAVKDAPNYSDDDDIDLEYENRVRQHFGLDPVDDGAGRGTYGPYPDEDRGTQDTDRGATDKRGGERTGTEGRMGNEERGEDQDAERRGESGGYRDEPAAAGRAGSDEESRGGRESGGDEGAVVGYREAEAGERAEEGEEPGLRSRRRRVRRRSLREENEEIIEEEENSGR